MLLYPEDVDRRLNWPLGRAERLARRKRLPHVILPDGSIRFDWSEVEPLLCRVDAEHGESDVIPARRETIRRLIEASDGKLKSAADLQTAHEAVQQRKGDRP